MGYAGNSGKKFSRALLLLRGAPERGDAAVVGKGGLIMGTA